MKRLIPYLMLASLMATTLSADENFKVKGEYEHVGRAKFRHTRSERGHHLEFRSGNVLGKYKHKLEHDRMIAAGVGYANSRYHFSHYHRHTSFHQKHFDNALFYLGGTTRELERWKWKLNLLAQVNTEHFKSNYIFFTGELYGRYEWHQNRNLYAGILAFTGLRYSRALPIVGFDYKFSDKWKLNAVFPIDMSLVYFIDQHWSVDAGIRYFLDRQRLGEHATYRRGFVAYRNWGAEGGLNYALDNRVRVKLHVGDAFAGRMRISNHQDHHRKHLKLDSSVYFGLDVSIAF